MALRSRVPNRKQLGGGSRRRNKNPKLSPFQRQQKRDRLANQPPINLTTRDYPASARNLVKYLQERDEREKEKRAKRLGLESAPSAPEDPTESSRSHRRESTSVPVAQKTEGERSSTGKGKKSLSTSAVVSLNDETAKEVGHGSEIGQYNEKILRLKEKKLRKKKQQRIERAIQRRDGLAKEVEAEVAQDAEDDGSGKKKKKRGAKDRDNEEGEGAPSASNPDQPPMSASARKRLERKAKKRAREEENDPNGEGSSRAGKKAEAFELDEPIDVVRFGERVDAPPVFDVAPSAANTAVFPVHRVGNAKKLELSERKRLQKLGLLPSLTSESDDAVHQAVAKRPTTSDEFEAYRQKVLESYAKHRKPSAVFHPKDFFKSS